jgi:spore coat polysaccharide biosynthesis protein SpsF
MAKIMDRPMVSWIIERLKSFELFDDICLATSHLEIDRPLIEIAKKEGILSYAGAPEDVLDRLYGAAAHSRADIVVEVGGDCPLIDYEVTKKALSLFEEENADYVTNVEPQTFPDGIDVHVVSFTALKAAHERAILSSQRLHPLSYFSRHKDEFKCVNFKNDVNLANLRWTLDYEEDFQLIKAVFKNLYPTNKRFGMKDILALLEAKPELKHLNAARIMALPAAEVPGYWYTRAYIRDMLKDIQSLAEKSIELDAQNQYQEEIPYLKEIVSFGSELLERARFLGKNQ